MATKDIVQLLKLPSRQRMELAERLWLSVADEKTLAVPEDHKKILRSRLSSYRAGKSKAVSHEEMMKRLRSS